MRTRGTIRWRIAVPYLALIMVTILGLSLFFAGTLKRVALDEAQSDLMLQARLVGHALRAPLAARDMGSVGSIASDYAALLGARITVIAPDGTVLAETDQDRAEMRNHLYRPEIQQALVAGQGTAVRPSDTIGVEMIYAAVSIAAGDEPLGFVRVALPERDLSAQLDAMRRVLAAVAAGASAMALVLAVLVAESTTRPVRRLSAFVRRLADGELDQRLLASSNDEVGQLTDDVMEMAERLRGTIAHLNAESARLSGVLNSMADAVLISNGEGNVTLMNPAAQQLLFTTQQEALGRSFTQVVRHFELAKVWEATLDASSSRSELVDLGDRFLQITVSALDDVEPGTRLVVLQDLTHVRRLEGIRREFVSNISHELRTPLASMRAIVDTLAAGALDDPPAARRFVERMDAEIDALSQMVEELLELSRIESGRVPIRLERIALPPVVRAAVERLLPQAERAHLTVTLNLSDMLPLVLGDGQRLQQVVTNLVHNAIKFTPGGGSIQIEARAADDRVVVSVSDTGVGIPPALHERVFERFFKADRSRSTAGTGLGLAIAKHIVLAHGGQIWVESEPGKGSRFFFTVLRAPAA
jgi:two-component system phosphate regulon sensor histidine kinase PhoR